jgi:hypothetical protein
MRDHIIYIVRTNGKSILASTTGDGWVPMTLQRVMEIIIGKEAETNREKLSNHLSINQQLSNSFNRPPQNRRPKTNPDVAPVFRGEILPEHSGKSFPENGRLNLEQNDRQNDLVSML